MGGLRLRTTRELDRVENGVAYFADGTTWTPGDPAPVHQDPAAAVAEEPWVRESTHETATALVLHEITADVEITADREAGVRVTVTGPRRLVEAVEQRVQRDVLAIGARAARGGIVLGGGTVRVTNVRVSGQRGPRPLQIRIAVPRGTAITVGEIDGAVRIPDTDGDLTAGVETGSVVAGRVASAVLTVDGPGTIQVGAVRGSLHVRSDGSGDAETGDVTDGADVEVESSGGVTVGAVGGDLRVDSDGSGGVRAGAVAGGALVRVLALGGGALRAEHDGSRDVIVAELNAAAEITITSSGGVRVGAGTIPELRVESDGSGSVRIDGTVARGSCTLESSGGVMIARTTGPLRVDREGSGRVRVLREG